MQSRNKEAKKKTVSQLRESRPGVMLFPFSLFYAFLSFRWNGTGHTGVLLLSLGIISNIFPVIKFDVDLIILFHV